MTVYIFFEIGLYNFVLEIYQRKKKYTYSHKGDIKIFYIKGTPTLISLLKIIEKI